MNVCKHCGVDLKIGFGNRRVFCSDKCSRAYSRKKQKGLIESIISKSNKIIQAKKLCISSDYVCGSSCPYYGLKDCVEKLEEDTYKLLIEYKKENESLKASQVKKSTNELFDLLMNELEKQKEICTSKKLKFKNGTSYFQYWLGKEEAIKQCIEIMKKI